MARAPDDNSFEPLPSRNISKVVKLTHSWLMHLNIKRLIFCNPGNVKGYLINPFMAKALEVVYRQGISRTWRSRNACISRTISPRNALSIRYMKMSKMFIVDKVLQSK